MEDRYYLVAAPFLMSFVIGGLCLFMAWPLWPAFLYLGTCLPLIAIIFAARNNFTHKQKEQILKKADFDHLLGLPPNYINKLKQSKDSDSKVA